MRKPVCSIIAAAALVLSTSQAMAANTEHAQLTKEEVLQAQQAWGEALISISQAYTQGGREQAEQRAREVLDAAYGYGHGKVLFKPTLASGETTFRTEHDGALAYFVGGNPAYPGDSGFALKGWQAFEVENAGVFINGDLALTMGNVMLTDAEGNVTTVDKTWGFQRDEEGGLRIILHHSSLPFEAS
ncbi:hypothetical protein [Pseudomonas sp.]|uniref:hypothetical protein n=1 Tax=Pseudomonas sp. TaxID=306 RepID=UPI00272AC806|nr:hypothetical protein [Pseudomonas sp.]